MITFLRGRIDSRFAWRSSNLSGETVSASVGTAYFLAKLRFQRDLAPAGSNSSGVTSLFLRMVALPEYPQVSPIDWGFLGETGSSCEISTGVCENASR